VRALVLDTETTGLIQNHTVRRALWPEIIEFASVALDWESGEESDHYSTLIKPSKKLDPKIVEITHLTDDALADQQPFSALAGEIRRRIESADLIIAHNASYDTEMLSMEFERIDQKVAWPRSLCTVEQSINLKGHRLTLSELHEHLFGLEHQDAHRAATDVKALVRIVKELIRKEML
jgi:DNA polymerase III epsilon subunit-like protein